MKRSSSFPLINPFINQLNQTKMAKFEVKQSNELATTDAAVKALATHIAANSSKFRTKLQASGLPVYNGQIIKEYLGLSTNAWTRTDDGKDGNFVVAVLKDNHDSVVRVPLTLFIKEGQILNEDRSPKKVDRIPGGIGDIIATNSDLVVEGAVEAINKGFKSLLKGKTATIEVKTEIDYLLRNNPSRFHTINLA